MNIYLASSWRNTHYPAILKKLRDCGFFVYDFRNDKTAFSWKEVSDIPEDKWSYDHYISVLVKPKTKAGFSSDFGALIDADTVVLVTPCGPSAHLELGMGVGQKKRTAIFVAEEPVKPELMYKMVDLITNDFVELVRFLRA